MHRKILFILIFSGFSSFVYPVTESLLEAEQQPLFLTLEEVTKLTFENCFDIQLAQFDVQFKETDLDKVRSIYDTLIEAKAEFEDDRKKSASSFAGTKSQIRNYNFGVSKKLLTGTTLELDFDNQRLWSNWGFTTINPAQDSMVKMTLTQELGRNFFGLCDRGDIKITKLDIQNAQYTSLDKIEEMLVNVQKTYWQVVRYLNAIKIREDILLKADELFQINKQRILKGIIEKPQLAASEVNLRQKEIDLMLTQNELEFHINELKFLLNLEEENKVILPGENFDGSIISAGFKQDGKIAGITSAVDSVFEQVQYDSKDAEGSHGINFVAPAIELNEALKFAFEHRRDYFKAKNEIDSRKIKLIMKKNNLWPEINLEASFGRNGLSEHLRQAVEDISSEDNPEYFLGLKLTFPLENRQARSELNKAKIEKARALVNFKKIERRILIEIKDSVRNCSISRQRLSKQGNVVKLQKEKLAAELKAYQYGRSDSDTLIRYQDDLLHSRLLYIEALLNCKVDFLELYSKENIFLDRFWEGRL